MQEDLAYLAEKLNTIKDQGASRKNGNAANKVLGGMVDAIQKKVDALYVTLVASIEGTNITGEEKLREKISDVYYGVLSYEGKPTQSQLDRLKGLQKEYQDAAKAAEKIFSIDLKALNAYLVKAKQDEVKLPSREDWDKETLK